MPQQRVKNQKGKKAEFEGRLRAELSGSLKNRAGTRVAASGRAGEMDGGNADRNEIWEHGPESERIEGKTARG